MPAFHIRDGLVHLDDVCLFRTPLGDAPTIRALGRLVAESVDSWRTADGLMAYPRAHLYQMTVLDAVCHLLPHVESIGVETTVDGPVTPGVAQTSDTIRVTVPGTFQATRSLCSLTAYCDQTNPTVVGVNEPLHPCKVTEAYVIVVTLRDGVPPLCAPSAEYREAASRNDFMIRIHVSSGDGPHGSGVYLYRCGLLWSVDASITTYRAIVDVHSTHPSELIPRVSPEEADVIASELLYSPRLAVLQSGALAPLLAEMGLRWAHLFRPLWRLKDAQEMVNLLRNASTPDALLPLLDVSALINQRVDHERTNIIGYSILRRMQTDGCTRDADWLATTVSEFAVARFQVLPIPAKRFAHLYNMRCFNERDEASCEYGLLVGNGDMRTVVVPMKSSPSAITHALAHLLKCEVAIQEDSRTDAICFPMSDGHIFTEGTMRCSPDETLQMYRVRVDTASRTLVLTLDASTKAKPTTDGVHSMDEMETLNIPTQSSRTRKAELMDLFPELTQRISTCNMTARHAIVREVQGRRVCQEWTMEGINSGKNLSSLGMTILLALLMGMWEGCCVRIALSRTRAAMFAVLNDSNEFVLVDPTRTTLNLLEASDYLMNVPTSSTVIDLPKGAVVEVRSGTRWLTAVVRNVDPSKGQFGVEFVHNMSKSIYSIRSHTWRRVSDDASDLDRLVRSFLDAKRRQSVGEMDGAPRKRACP